MFVFVDGKCYHQLYRYAPMHNIVSRLLSLVSCVHVITPSVSRCTKQSLVKWILEISKITDKPIEEDIWSWGSIHFSLTFQHFFGEKNLRYGYCKEFRAHTVFLAHYTLLKYWECEGKQHWVLFTVRIAARFKKKWVNNYNRQPDMVTQHRGKETCPPTQCYGECATKSGHWKHCLRTLVTWAP